MNLNINWISVASVGALLLAAGGCSSVDSGVSEPLAKTQDQLAAYDFGSWTAWTMPINVCFQKASTPPTNTQYAALKAEAFSTLTGSWQQVPGVSFVNQGDCAGSTPTYLHIVLGWAHEGGSCGIGVGATCSLAGVLDNGPNINSFRGLLNHEVGHALGFGHEHQRPDGVYANCEYDRVVACQSCKAKIDINQACSATDWNACATPQTPVSTPQIFSTSSPQYGTILEMLGNNAPDSSFELLTIYDPHSVMSYCAVPNGRDPNEFQPTALDLLGAEMTYPLNTTYPIGCQSGCFYSGNGVISRTDGALTTNWTARGGLNVEIISPLNGAHVASFGTGGLSGGSSTLTFNFVAPRTGTLLTTSGNLMNSNAYHSAVVSALTDMAVL